MLFAIILLFLVVTASSSSAQILVVLLSNSITLCTTTEFLLKASHVQPLSKNRSLSFEAKPADECGRSVVIYVLSSCN